MVLAGNLYSESLVRILTRFHDPYVVEAFVVARIVVVGEVGELSAGETCFYVESYGHGEEGVLAETLVELLHIDE